MTTDKRLEGWKRYDLHVAPEGSTTEDVERGVSAIFSANLAPFVLAIGETHMFVAPEMNASAVRARIEAAIPKETH